jgi:adhesin/invasin
MRLFRLFMASGLVFAWLACGEDGGGPGTPTVSELEITGGNTQVGVAGQPLATPLSVFAHDIDDEAVAGVTVTWSAASGGGSVNPTSSVTNALGIATATRTLGANAGAQTTTATVAGVAPVTFNAVAQIQGATQIALSAGNNQTDTVLATVAVPLAVLVQDQTSTPVQGVVVNWAAQGGGSVSAPTSTTNASGVATVTRTFGATAGPQGATATVTGLAGSPVSFTLTATAGNAAVLVKTAGDNGTVAPSGQAIYTVTARDNHSNPKSGVTIDWATASGSIAPPSNTTSSNGAASATHTLSATLGAQTATATATGLTGSPATFTTTAANITNVTVGGAANAFNPASITITVNGTVSWNWAANNTLPHNVTFAGGAGAPSNITDLTAGSASRQFTATGTFNYSCTNHIGMTGSVTVNP